MADPIKVHSHMETALIKETVKDITNYYLRIYSPNVSSPNSPGYSDISITPGDYAMLESKRKNGEIVRLTGLELRLEKSD